MAFVDYYKILGISKTADEKEIKKAFRQLARKYHPDLNPNNKASEKKFKEINEANEVLSDPENRKKYDKYGKDWKHADEFDKARKSSGGGQQQRGSQQYSQEEFSDFFNSMFGGGRSQRQQASQYKGQDFHADLPLDLVDVYEDHKKTVSLGKKKIRLTIPAGVVNEQVIKIKGKGSPGINGGPAGDLYIKFIINNTTKFRRDKENLYSTVSLDLYTALLGGEITVDTFEGKVKLKVKPETESGTKVKLKGKGFPVYKKKNLYGDLYLTYDIKLPTKLSKEEKELFLKLKKLR